MDVVMMKTLLALCCLLPTLAQAQPDVKLSEDEEGRLVFEYFNNTGDQLSVMILPMVWQYQDKPNHSEQSKWGWRTGDVLVEVSLMGGEVGRTEVVGSSGVPFDSILSKLPPEYDRVKLKVILVWGQPMQVDWMEPESRVFYLDITERLKRYSNAGE